MGASRPPFTYNFGYFTSKKGAITGCTATTIDQGQKYFLTFLINSIIITFLRKDEFSQIHINPT